MYPHFSGVLLEGFYCMYTLYMCKKLTLLDLFVHLSLCPQEPCMCVWKTCKQYTMYNGHLGENNYGNLIFSRNESN